MQSFYDGSSSQYGTWGLDASLTLTQADGSTSTSSTSAAPLVSALAPIAGELFESITDPYRKAEVLRAKLQIARAKGASLNTIMLLEAKLKAAERRVAEEEAGEEAKRGFIGLGQAAGVVGIGIGLSLVYLILSKARS